MNHYAPPYRRETVSVMFDVFSKTPRLFLFFPMLQLIVYRPMIYLLLIEVQNDISHYLRRMTSTAFLTRGIHDLQQY